MVGGGFTHDAEGSCTLYALTHASLSPRPSSMYSEHSGHSAERSLEASMYCEHTYVGGVFH